eukprot:g1609.t1
MPPKRKRGRDEDEPSPTAAPAVRAKRAAATGAGAKKKSREKGAWNAEVLAREDSFVNLLKAIGDSPCLYSEAAVRHHMKSVGCATNDVAVVKLIGLAARKFADDIIKGAWDFHRQSIEAGTPGVEHGHFSLSELKFALREKGIMIK